MNQLNNPHMISDAQAKANSGKTLQNKLNSACWTWVSICLPLIKIYK